MTIIDINKCNVLDTRQFGVIDGYDITAVLVSDEETALDHYNEYDEETAAAFKALEWGFVAIIVTASRAGITLGTADVWACEYGYMPRVPYFVNPLTDGEDSGGAPGLGRFDYMIREAIDAANTTLGILIEAGK